MSQTLNVVYAKIKSTCHMRKMITQYKGDYKRLVKGVIYEM